MAAAIAIITMLAALLIMAGEAVLSSFNEKALRARGAIEPANDVINMMRWAYPGAFVAMGIEGALMGPAPRNVLLGGLVLLGLSKALKLWAISSLGSKWSYRVLVVQGDPLVKTGPSRWSLVYERSLDGFQHALVVRDIAGPVTTRRRPARP